MDENKIKKEDMVGISSPDFVQRCKEFADSVIEEEANRPHRPVYMFYLSIGQLAAWNKFWKDLYEKRGFY